MSKIDPNNINIILATDCGSTTSKARFFKKIGEEYRYIISGEAPTTVEAPYEDVTMGVKNAVREIEEFTGHKLLASDGIIMPSNGNEGVDLYVTTSSAGGGLQMMVAGAILNMTAESAERAALGAGAIVMDVMARDDGRKIYQKIQRIRNLRPDIILLAGGTDGGDTKLVTENAELIAAAEPKARLGVAFELPIVYAGNRDAREKVRDLLDKKFELTIVDNLRPLLEVENIEPARNSIHTLFMEHVMSHAPGYDKLMKWTPIPIMPTPAGEGRMVQTLAELHNINVIGVGLGGATTNVYSSFDGRYVRTVSANLGMSYSIVNVMSEAGIENILRWLPFKADKKYVYSRLGNKMIRPTTIPQTLEELLLEHAVAREALRLGFKHHKSLARGLIGLHSEVGLRFGEEYEEIKTYIDLMRVDMICATGGLLSHAPRRSQAALTLMDGFLPEGLTQLSTDSVFMMPHLGVLSTVHSKASVEIFERDCLVRLGTCIAPKGEASEDDKVRVSGQMPDGTTVTEEVPYGSIKVIPLSVGKTATLEITPPRRCNVGAGAGRKLKSSIEGGVTGIIIDARGRPLAIPEDAEERRRKLFEWFTSMDAYPKENLQMYLEG